LVSIMGVNNEIGVVQPLREIGKVIFKSYWYLIHNIFYIDVQRKKNLLS
jgi:cysteine sulfinate desulfinase/cysteine desulfurase-like protein